MIGRSVWTTVIVLAIANTLSFVDRLLPSILLDPIRTSLALSDTQMGLLHGLPFALFYATVGLWLGQLADRVHRPRLIAVGIALWSAATVSCAFAQGFWSFLAARVGVAVGEATLAPAAYALIAALFAAERLGRALSVYQIGIYLGSGLALVIGGWLAADGSADGWRTAFIVAGLPGLVVAAGAALLPEPRAAATQPHQAAEWGRLARGAVSTYRAHFLGFSLIGIAAYGITSWLPSVLVRLHGVALNEAGLKLGLIVMLVSPFGVLTSAWLADRAAARGDSGAPFVIAAAGALLLVPATAAYGFAPNAFWALLASAPLAFLSSFPFGVAALALQRMTPPAERGRMSSLYLLVFTLIGYGIGPVAVGLASDHLFGGPMGVGRSITLVVALSAPLAALLLLTGRRRAAARIDGIIRGTTYSAPGTADRRPVHR